MFKLSNGVMISEDTIVAALEKAGIETKPKHVFKAGDVAMSYGNWRFIVHVEGKLHSVNKRGVKCSIGQDEFEYYNYQYVGKLEDLLKLS